MARHLALGRRFFRAALAVVTRATPTSAKAKRTGKAKGRTTGGGQLAMRARIDKKRIAKHVARIAHLTRQAKKIEPKRPGDVRGPGMK